MNFSGSLLHNISGPIWMYGTITGSIMWDQLFTGDFSE